MKRIKDKLVFNVNQLGGRVNCEIIRDGSSISGRQRRKLNCNESRDGASFKPDIVPSNSDMPEIYARSERRTLKEAPREFHGGCSGLRSRRNKSRLNGAISKPPPSEH